ncbi:hypothetical protein [Rothia uropygialis]|uniref:hypothetical protein n=1 Tax=Kocuria sp. 36 TaxID=1415402 RepID=UPI00101BA68C|nr:hypothetical protein [Kocuria sp. 36]
MSQQHDPLEAFDKIPDTSHESVQQEDLRPRRQDEYRPRSRAWKPILGLLVVLAILALILWRCSDTDRSEDSSSGGPAPASSSSSAPTSTASASDVVDGYGPQAPDSSENKPSYSSVNLPKATAPEVDTHNSDSVMKAFLTAINTRDKAEDGDQVSEWVSRYSRIDVSDIDPYQANGLMSDKAPARSSDVKFGNPTSKQDVTTSTQKSKTATVTVQSASGQKTTQEWELTTGKDGEDWKVQSVHLVSVTGKK